MNKSAWDWPGFYDYLFNEYLVYGVLTTIGLTVASIVGGLILGAVLALMRLSPLGPVSWLAQAYIWLFRGSQPTPVFTLFPCARKFAKGGCRLQYKNRRSWGQSTLLS